MTLKLSKTSFLKKIKQYIVEFETGKFTKKLRIIVLCIMYYLTHIA